MKSSKFTIVPCRRDTVDHVSMRGKRMMENILDATTDPSDWKAFPPLRELDSLLRCPICFDYYSTAMMMPNCSHNYCSMCIRKFLALRPVCPTCSAPATESQLRNNRVLDELMQHFTSSRRDFLGLVRMLGTTRNGVQLSPVPLNTGDMNCKTVATQTELCDSDTTTTTLYSRLPAGTDGETSMNKVAGSPHTIPKPPSLVVLDDENLFGEQKSSPSLSLQTISIPVRGEEEADEKRGVDMVNSVDANRPLNKREEEPKRKRELDGVYPNTPPSKRRNSSTSYDACMSPYPGPGEARMPPMIFGTPKTLLPGNRSGTSVLEVPVPSSSVLGTPLGHNVQKAVSSASPSPSVSSASKVECPVCGLLVLEKAVNSHLDVCLARMTKPPSNPGPNRQLPRLPKMCFNIMNDKQLRKQLREYHLPTNGSKQAMKSRLQEFTLRYNAQCDSLDPKTPKEIAQEVEKNERARHSVKATTSNLPTMNIRKDSSAQEIEQHRLNYEKEHKDHFAKLLSEVQWRQNKKEASCVSRSPGVRKVARGGRAKPLREESSEEDGDSDSDSDVLVLDSPENCSKMPAGRLTETTIIPESPRVLRESTRSRRRRSPPFSVSSPLSSPSSHDVTGRWEEEDPDFLPSTPFRTRRKQKRQ